MELPQNKAFFCVCDKPAILSQNVWVNLKTMHSPKIVLKVCVASQFWEKRETVLETIIALGYISNSYSMGESKSF